MPVYDYTYRTWTGTRRGPLARWLTIPKFTYREFLGKRLFIWLFTMAWLQFLLRAGYLYLKVNAEVLKSFNIPTHILPPADAFFFKNLIDLQLVFCFLFAFLLGAPLISRDLRHNALVLYMSKPIHRAEYFWGKFFTVFSLLLLVTWVQAAALFAVQTLAAPAGSDWLDRFWTESLPILGAASLYAPILCATLTMLTLAASSLTSNSRYAGTILAVYIIGSSVMANVMRETLGHSWCLALSPFFAAVDLGYYLFHLPEKRHMGLLAAWAGVVLPLLLSGGIFHWRLRYAARYGR